MQDQEPTAPSPSDARRVDDMEVNVHEVDRRLTAYGTPNHHNKPDPLDELVFIILSAQTEEYTYLGTYEALRTAFPGWHGLADAPPEVVEELIRSGGLYRKKTSQIQGALRKIVEDTGRPSLDFLREWDDVRALAYLLGIPGVAQKTALCIMLYSLGRTVFPVDTHVWRVSRRLGIAPQVPKPTARHERELGALIPAEVRYSLHVNMVAHGRTTCLVYWPKCGVCPLLSICPSRGLPDYTWGRWRRPRGSWAQALTP